MNATRTLELETRSPAETEALGLALARILPKGSVVALYGDLATGKTCLVRGMALLHTDSRSVHSPTFTLVNEYGPGPALYHLDLYRLGGPEELADLGYEEIFDAGAVCVIEWAERAGALLPQHRIDIHLEHAGGDRRRIRIDNAGLLENGWPARLRLP